MCNVTHHAALTLACVDSIRHVNVESRSKRHGRCRRRRLQLLEGIAVLRLRFVRVGVVAVGMVRVGWRLQVRRRRVRLRDGHLVVGSIRRWNVCNRLRVQRITRDLTIQHE